jgi:hypothetical protein
MVSKIFCWVFNFQLRFIELWPFKEIDRKCLIYGETSWPNGKVGLFVSYWLQLFLADFSLFTESTETSVDTEENVPNWSPLLSRLFPNCLHYFVRIADKIYNTPWSFPEGFQYLLGIGFKVSNNL